MKKHIPNIITCCNLICGCIAVGAAFQNPLPVNYFWAIVFILLGAIFDFFDGMVARALGVSSPIGKELDSLADVVTFGVAPSAMLFSLFQEVQYPEFLEPLRSFMPYTAFILAAFSALRLAKFNIDTRQTSSFIGLPTPANALFWASLVAGLGGWIKELNYGWLLMLGLIAIFSYLLVSEIPMFSLKFKSLRWRSNKVRYIFLIFVIPMLFLGIGAAVAIISWYLALSTALYIQKSCKKA